MSGAGRRVQVDAANAKAVASESEVASSQEGCGGAAARSGRLQAGGRSAQGPSTGLSLQQDLTPFHTAPLPGNMLVFLHSSHCCTAAHACPVPMPLILATTLASDLA